MKSDTRSCDGLKESHKTLVIEILLKRKAVKAAWLFGSRAMGTYRSNSDIDLVLGGDNITLSDVAAVLSEIELTTIPYKVDIVIKHKITSEKLLEHIDLYGVRWV
ncbi:nucleotidyltransferase domain-containing protein [Aliivibrio kagoshimensis]|uniref:nucleotidyltransferase domain-containing protein n=1 Tax=Aliivibrio kagoshimensis TaxID=2910230 RepID=UPI003D0D5567